MMRVHTLRVEGNKRNHALVAIGELEAAFRAQMQLLAKKGAPLPNGDTATMLDIIATSAASAVWLRSPRARHDSPLS